MTPAAGSAALPAGEIAVRVSAGDLSAESVVAGAFAAIERLDPALHAFLHRRHEAAAAEARSLDARRAAGNPPGPLAGVPVAVKDNICLAGAPATCGSRILEGYEPPYDATVIERLRAAGAIVVGKTNLDEFAMGSSTENSAFGPSRNPWNVERVPGGSSGGSAVAVAAGLTPLALGSDTGGSVRQPAGFCGVYGLKPTWGRVSRYGLVAFASSLDQVGAFARSVSDLEALHSVLAGPDPRDATSAGAPAPDAAARRDGPGVHGLTIAFPESVLGWPGVSADVAAATRAAAAQFERLGARIEPVDFPDLDAGIAAYYLIGTAEASSNLARYDGIRYGARAAAADLHGLYAETRDRGFGAEVKRRIMLGTFALSSGYYDAYYGRAMAARRRLRDRFRALFGRADILLLPTSPTTAFRFGDRTADPLQMYLADVFTVFANLTGGPALSMPAGFGADGLPIGVQLAAGEWREDRLFAAARAFEGSTDHAGRRPPICATAPAGGRGGAA